VSRQAETKGGKGRDFSKKRKEGACALPSCSYLQAPLFYHEGGRANSRKERKWRNAGWLASPLQGRLTS